MSKLAYVAPGAIHSNFEHDLYDFRHLRASKLRGDNSVKVTAVQESKVAFSSTCMRLNKIRVSYSEHKDAYHYCAMYELRNHKRMISYRHLLLLSIPTIVSE